MVVVDSSAIIPLLNIGKLELIRKNFSEFVVPQIVWEEVVENGKLFGKPYSLFAQGKNVWFSIVSERKKEEAKTFAKEQEIQEADAEIILLAKERNQILLTNDAAMYACCLTQGIQSWWLTTLVLASVKKKIITKNEAEQILFELVTTGNMHLRTDVFVELLLILKNL